MTNEDRFQSVNFNRPPRIQFAPLKDEHVEIPSPPPLPSFTDQGLIVTLLPVLGIGVMAMFYVLRAIGSSGDSFLFAIPMFFLAIFTIGGTVMAQRWRRRDYMRRQRETEINYLRALDRVQTRLQAAHNVEVGLLEFNFPAPEKALSRALARDPQLWERRPQDADFVGFRLGTGSFPSRVTISAPTTPLESPLLDRALAIADRYRLLNDAPIVASLRDDVSIGMCGKRTLVLQLVCAAVCQLAITHAPQDLHVHLITSKSNYDDWRWLEWLPHASQSHRGGAAELIAIDHANVRNLMGNLAQVIDERREQKSAATVPHLLVILDDPKLVETEPVLTTILREGGHIGASAICIVGSYENIPSDCGTVVEIADDQAFRYARTGTMGFELEGRQIDVMSLQNTEHIARALSSVVMRETGGAGRIPRYVDFLDLYGVRYVEQLPQLIRARWRRPVVRGVLPHPVVIGSESLSVRTELLLDEDHHGPHGVLAGTTGSGKSELLQTLICSMILEHDPRLLTLLLIDFKGGSTFNGFSQLPHVVGMVTNLDGTLIERALEALRAEVQWRQQFLNSRNVRDITQYHRNYTQTEARLSEPDYHPLPHLFILVDEFAQLAREMPDFLRELVRIVQVGRSLGLHLILGTQSPMDVITDEMNANLQFRICLRVQNIEASRAMLRRPDAAYLPAGWPGRGYFQVGERGVFKQFQTAYVGGDYERSLIDETNNSEPAILELITDTGQIINLLEDSGATFLSAETRAEATSSVARAICDTVIRFAQDENIPWMRPILLPPLPDLLTLAEPFQECGIGGWNGHDWNGPGRDHDSIPIRTGSAPVGLMDDVYNRKQHPLWIHLNAGDAERSGHKDGHVMIVGSPGTGKTAFLRTLAISEAILHSPERMQMYFLSFTGTGLDDLGSLPHAERVIYGTETERVRRLFARMLNILNERQSGRADAFSPVIMLCVDQFEQLRDAYRESFLIDFERLINEGRSAGIYVVFTASTANAVPDRIRSLVQQRITLQVGDSGDYGLLVGRLDREMTESLHSGRGFLYNSPPLLCQISLPCIRAGIDNEPLALESMRTLIREMRTGYETKTQKTQSPAPIRELPTRIPLEALSFERHDSSQIRTPLGHFDDDALSPYMLDWQEEGPHFIVTGPPGSGKTNLLQAAVLSAAQSYPPERLRFLLVDFNGRSLRALGGLKHVIRRVTDPLDLREAFNKLSAELAAFSELTQQDVISAATVPATVVVIDDYDSVSEELRMSDEVLAQLRDALRLYAHLNLYVWVGGYLERVVDPLIRHLLLKRSGFGLSVKESLQKLNVRSVGMPVEAMPEGRAYIPRGNRIVVVQTALVDDAYAYAEWVNSQWPDSAAASWQHGDQYHIQPAKPQQRPASRESITIDIDTAGLIQDLLGDLYDEGKTDGRPVD